MYMARQLIAIASVCVQAGGQAGPHGNSLQWTSPMMISFLPQCSIEPSNWLLRLPEPPGQEVTVAENSRPKPACLTKTSVLVAPLKLEGMTKLFRHMG